MGLFRKLFPTHNERELKKLRVVADKVEALQESYKLLRDEELIAKTAEFKRRIGNFEGAEAQLFAEPGKKKGKKGAVTSGYESLEDIMPEAFATVREAAARVLNMRHFYVQILGGIVLHEGRIAEMRTGEGKTLVATLPAYLNALTGNGVHVVTVNDYLARRDAEWMGKVHRFLGLTVGVITASITHDERVAAYKADITYATNNELGFDYLRDNMQVRKEDKLQRALNYALIDEVDSILIDEARTPLIISGKGENSSEIYRTADRFAKGLKGSIDNSEESKFAQMTSALESGEEADKGDFIIDEKGKTIRLTEKGVEKAEQFFRIENLSDIENQETVHYINNALRANHIMKRDKDYLAQDGEVLIVDEFTGRIMVGRRYSDGLHQAIEAKEGLKIQSESKTLATITFQNYFRLYKKLSGMTGTAKTEETEFADIYRLDVVEIPTNKPMIRHDENDKLFTTERGKYGEIVKDIEEAHAKGQPVLVGTVTVEKSEALSKVLSKKNLVHDVLNAKNHAREAEIVAQAGRLGAITIATNMAGRGTDIVLGGNPDYMAEDYLRKKGYAEEVIAVATSNLHTEDENALAARAEFNKMRAEFKIKTDKEHEEVLAAGGLRIIGTERHESRRIDNQLRGRAGRQGDVGATVFYLSTEDDIMRVFGGDRMKAVLERFRFAENEAIQVGAITKMIRNSQAQVEDRNYSARKHVLAYDDVVNYQRDAIYKERNKVLEGLDIHDQIEKMMDSVAQGIMNAYMDYDVEPSSWNIEAFNTALEEELLESGTKLLSAKLCNEKTQDELRDLIMDTATSQYEARSGVLKEQYGIDFRETERRILLKTVDRLWVEHLDTLQSLKEGIGLVAHAQRDPVIEYKRESFTLFDDMIEEMHKETVRLLCKTNFKGQIELIQHMRETGVKGGSAVEPSRPAGGKKASNAPKTSVGQETYVRKDVKVGKNDDCPCGSGKKYKNCCGK